MRFFPYFCYVPKSMKDEKALNACVPVLIALHS